MKKAFFSLFIFMSVVAFAQQGKKPTIMILPSDHWCTTRYFTTDFVSNGKKMSVNDYAAAFREDAELSGVVSKVGQMITGYGYTVKDFSQESANVNDRQMEMDVTTSSMGSSVLETPLDILRRKAKYDIEFRIDWTVNEEANGNSVSFTIEAIDSYTGKRIATSTGTGKASNDIIVRQLEAAVKSKMPAFDKQLTSFFNDVQKNGREINLILKSWDSYEVNMETEFDGDELIDIVQDWLKEYCVNGSFNLTDNSETTANFEQVRIPVLDEKERAMDARGFATQLRKYLSKAPYNLPCKVLNRGLGEAIIIIGEK